MSSWSLTAPGFRNAFDGYRPVKSNVPWFSYVSAPIADKNRENMATLEEENRRRAESVKPSQKSVKPDRNEDQS